MNRYFKKGLSLLLAVVMLVSMIPGTVFAEGETPTDIGTYLAARGGSVESMLLDGGTVVPANTQMRPGDVYTACASIASPNGIEPGTYTQFATKYKISEVKADGYKILASGEIGLIRENVVSEAKFTNTKSSVPNTGD